MFFFQMIPYLLKLDKNKLEDVYKIEKKIIRKLLKIEKLYPQKYDQ